MVICLHSLVFIKAGHIARTTLDLNSAVAENRYERYADWYRNRRSITDLEGAEARAIGHFGGHHTGNAGGGHPVAFSGGLLGGGGNVVGHFGGQSGHFGLGGILHNRYRGRY